MKTYPALN